MIPKSGYRFSEKIMLQQRLERDDDSKKSHPDLSFARRGPHAFPCWCGRNVTLRALAVYARNIGEASQDAKIESLVDG
jgi:hypothetical protein